VSGFRNARSRRSRAAELNMAPLLDMVFILLIFFIVTTSFVRESGVDVERPVARTAVSKEKTNLVIGVTEQGIVWIENRPVDIRSVRAHMERFLADTPDGSVVIAADRESRTGVLVEVFDACRQAGVRSISVAARRPQ
jgi:biopolymer transport protein ExbD